MEEKNELMQREEETGLFMVERKQAYSSWRPQTEEEKVDFYNMINSPQERLKDNINVVLEIQHVYAERVTLVNNDGELSECVRIILLTTDGKGYACVSSGVFNSLQKLFAIFGEPTTWKNPIKVMPKLISKGNNKSVLTLSLAK